MKKKKRLKFFYQQARTKLKAHQKENQVNRKLFPFASKRRRKGKQPEGAQSLHTNFV